LYNNFVDLEARDMSKKDYDGMRYPSVDDLLKVIDSKYKLAYAAARRAHIIEEEEWTAAEDGMCVKPVGQASPETNTL
jgi:DNA-directed RNA polymerase subunit omega